MIKIIDNIILIGTSHVAKESAKEIKSSINYYKPELICLELDYMRLRHLISKNKTQKKNSNIYYSIKELGLFGALFAQLGSFTQRKIAKSLGIEPGIDMKTGYIEARKNKIPTALIDINIKITLKKLSKIPFAKKISLFFSLFTKGFKKEYREKLNFDPKKGVPDEKQIIQMIKILSKETPILYKILIEDRNKHMAKKILELKQKHKGNIIAIMGAGHLDGVEKILKKEILKNKITFSFNIEI